MTNITDIKNHTVTGVFSIAGSIKADQDSTEVKHYTLKVHCNSVPLQDIVTKALSQIRITWANGPGRSKFATRKDHAVVDIDFSSPAKKIKTREEFIDEYQVAFMKAGVDKASALELATKAVDSPEPIT